MLSFYHEIIFRPLYNGLVGILALIPGIDLGIAVVIFTIIVKIILFPLSKSSIITQARMKEVEPELAKIRSQYKDDRQAQAAKTMELYKEKGIRPFAGIGLMFIQLPILLALISVFYKIIPTIDVTQLYTLIHAPVTLNTHFLGLIDLTQKSLILSIATGVIQFFQMHYSLASRASSSPSAAQTAGAMPDISSTMNTQMKYMLPVLAFASTYWLIPAKFPQAASIIAIYWSVSSLCTLAQELVIRRKYLNKQV